MREIIIAPSLLSADFSNLSKDVAEVEACGAGAFHCDVMDGHFVPNITFGPMVIKAVRSLTRLPMLVHLMIEHPERYVEQFRDAGASEITVHAEACVHLHRAIQQIKALGIQAGVALNPSTPLCMIEHIIKDIDILLIMTVNPGFGGQEFIEAVVPKIADARRMAEEAGANIDIAVDGGLDVDTAPRVVRAGANVLIAGSSVFGSNLPIKEAFELLRESAKAT
ncbi:MAG: ribulose-phosphate 3-epimerase [Armatimonadetes bacterium]|nr:ribulose-phosphate 3-epimerase [Armatimonadota bacterium]